MSAASDPDSGPALHPDLVPHAFLLGSWAGVGVGGYPTIEGFQFGQEVFFTHVGAASRVRESLLASMPAGVGPPWRPGRAATGARSRTVKLEVTLAHPTGVVEIWLGELTGTKIEMRTDVVARTATAKEVTAGHRLYGLVDGELLWAYDMAAMGQPLQPHRPDSGRSDDERPGLRRPCLPRGVLTSRSTYLAGVLTSRSNGAALASQDPSRRVSRYRRAV